MKGQKSESNNQAKKTSSKINNKLGSPRGVTRASLMGSKDNIIWGSSTGGIAKTAAGSTVEYYPPRWFSPMLSWVHFYMPTDLKTTITWLRHWDAFHPMVGNSIDLHTTVPLSRFSLKVADPIIKNIYKESFEACGGLLLLYSILRDYWLLGEAFTYLFWDDESGIFTDAQLIPPEDLIVEDKGWLAGGQDAVEYKVQVAMRSFSPEMNPLDKAVLEKLPPAIIEALRKGEAVPLSPFFIMPFQRKQSPYMTRGTSIVLRVMKDLLYEDKLREAQFAIAQRYINPKELWHIGSDTWPATQDQIDALEQAVKTAEQNPLFTLVANHTVRAEYVMGGGALSPLKQEFDWIEDRVLTALFTSKAVTHGEGPTYANASVAMRVLMARYSFVRSLLENVLTERFFLPIAIAHEFYETTTSDLGGPFLIKRPFSERKPILPTFEWQKNINLLDSTSIVGMVGQMRDLGFPMKIISDVLNVDYDEVRYWKEEEEGTIFDPFYSEWRRKAIALIPPPIGPTGKEATFKLPVVIGERQGSKYTKEPIIEEKEFKWADGQNIMEKLRLVNTYIVPWLEKGKAIPADVVFRLKVGEDGNLKLEGNTKNGAK